MKCLAASAFTLALVFTLLLPTCAENTKSQLIESFESSDCLSYWLDRDVKAQLTSDHATEGKQAVRLTYPKYQAGGQEWPAFILTLGKGSFGDGNWAPYEVIKFDAFNDSDATASISLRVDDARGGRLTYRHFELPSRKKMTLTWPMELLESGIDTSAASRFDLFMSTPKDTYTIYLDNIRLESASQLVLQGKEITADPIGRGNNTATLRFNRGANVLFEVVNSAGKAVSSHQMTGKLAAWTWDGKTDGKDASPGTYSIRATYKDTVYESAPVTLNLARVKVVKPSQRQLCAWYAQSTRKVMLDDKPLIGDPFLTSDAIRKGKAPAPLKIDMARNEYEAAQVVFLAGDKPLKMSFEFEGLKNTKSGVAFDLSRSKIYQMGYVLTKKPGIYAVERDGWWPDPIVPVDEMIAEPGECMPIWVSLRSSTTTAPGAYRGKIAVKIDGKRIGSVPLEVQVYNHTLPDSTTLTTAFTYDEGMVTKLFGDKWPEGMRFKYMEFLADHRLNVDHLYRRTLPNIEDIDMLARRGWINAFNLCYVGCTNQKAIDDLCAMLDPYVAELRKRNLVKYAYLYGYDEITSADDLMWMQRTFTQLKKRYPEIPLSTTAKDLEYKMPEVDIFTPLTAEFNFKAAKEAEARGKTIWWYTCIGPQHPYANWFIEYPAIESRLLFWMTWQNEVPGYLYYYTDYWINQAKPMTITGSNKTDWIAQSWTTANGDGSVFCAGPDGPITTIRFENIRDGIEDYEILTGLTKKLADKGKTGKNLCNKILKSLTEFTTDPKEFGKARVELLRTVEK